MVRHDYLSTSCLHGHHDYCQRERGLAGDKTPAVCKFCGAPCRCHCHTAATAVPARCEDCGRTARQLIPVLDAHGRTTGWVGPTCLRNRQVKAGRGVQLPLEQEGPPS
jgi:hypothetical protein